MCVCVSTFMCIASERGSCLITCFIFTPFPRSTTQFVTARDTRERENFQLEGIENQRELSDVVTHFGAWKKLNTRMSERAAAHLTVSVSLMPHIPSAQNSRVKFLSS